MQSRLKIMQVIGARGAGGAETFYLRLVRALAPHCDVVPVVRKGSWIAGQLEADGIAFHALPFGGPLDFRTKPALKKLIEDDVRPHLVQTWMNRASSVLPKTDVPTIARLGGYYDLKYYEGIDWFVGNTQGICDYLERGGCVVSRVRYIPNFAPAPKGDAAERAATLRQTIGLPADARTVLMAGRLHENKAFDVGLAALAELPEQVHALVAGEGEEESALKSLASDLGIEGRTHFMGWTDDISPLAALADLWWVPSRHEPLGNVVLDAWMNRVPVLAARSDGPASLIEDGVTGSLVPVEDAVALADAALGLLNDPDAAAAMAEAGFARAQEDFSEAAVVRKYLVLFIEVLERAQEAAA